MLFMSKQKLVSVFIVAGIQVILRWFGASRTYLHTGSSEEGAGLHVAWHSQVLVTTAPSTCLQPQNKGAEGEDIWAGLNGERTFNTDKTIFSFGKIHQVLLHLEHTLPR